MKTFKLLGNLKVAFFFVLLIFLFFGGITEYAYNIQKKDQQFESRIQAVDSAQNVATHLEKTISHNLSLTQGLAGIIQTSQGQLSPTGIREIIQYIHSKGSSIRNIVVAPNNVLKYVYPLEGNEMILGKRYEDIPEQWKDIEVAIQTREPFISGPIDLIQGGKALIYRIPVFLKSGQYYGLVNIVLDLDKLLDERNILPYMKKDQKIIIQSNGYILFQNDVDLKGKKTKPETEDIPTSNLKILIFPPNVSGAELQSLQSMRLLGWGINLLSCLLLLLILRENYIRRKVEKKLIYAKEEAERASLAKSQFLTNMSHEIRTPLNAVMGFTQILLDMKRSQEEKDYLKKIRYSSKYLLDILSDILDFSRIESGRLSLNVRPVALSEIFKETEVILGYNAEFKQIRLEFNIDKRLDGKWFLADSVRFKQVLLNIIGNAIKFTEVGEVVFRVELESIVDFQEGNARDSIPEEFLSFPDPGSIYNLYFSVKDTGVGIDEEEKQNLFQNFSRGNDKKNKKYSGTGLGLAISKNLIELMGGVISFRSEPNQGSDFFFSIPFLHLPNHLETQSLRDVHSIPNKDSLGIKLNPHKILLVEDNQLNQIVTKKLLNKLNQDVVIADNGLLAIQTLESNPDIELVFMDISMPVMDGVEATKNIRRNEAFQNLPILALTAHASQENREEYLKAGMDEHITKPVDKKELERYLIEFLEKPGTI